jgi:uncharacterized protein
MSLMSLLSMLVSGTLFGFGLALSTMLSPEVILSFLRFRDRGLMLVMSGAVSVSLLAYQFAPRLRRKPVFGVQFDRHRLEPTRQTVVGAALFGVGWGLCGVCPGPAIAGLGVGNWPALYSLAGLAAGAWLQGVAAERGWWPIPRAVAP